MLPMRALRLWMAIRVWRSSGPYAVARSPITLAGLRVPRPRGGRPWGTPLDEPAAGTFAASTQTRKGLGDMDRTEPGLQEAGPEGQDELGFPQVIAQGARHPLHELMSEGGSLRRQAANPDVVRSAVCLGEALPERVPIAAVLPAQDRHRVRETLGSEVGQPGGQHREGFVPSDGAEAPALTVARHRPLQAVRIVEELKPPECLGAEGSPVDGMEGIPREPRHLAVERSDHETAPARTLLADGGDRDLFGSGPACEILSRLLGLGQRAPAQGGGPGRSACCLKESPSRDSHRVPQRWQALQSVETRLAATFTTPVPFSLGPSHCS